MAATLTTDRFSPTCIATTGRSLCKDSRQDQNGSDHDHDSIQGSQVLRSKSFRGAQFSSDGTTVLAQHEDQCFRSFVIPANLLDESKQPHKLESYCTTTSPSPIRGYALYPHFDLQNTSTTVTLRASEDLPISLSNVLHPDATHAKYPLINPTTEACIAPHSLTWTRDGTHFVAGSKKLISVFDASYDGSGPISSRKTAPGKTEMGHYGRSGLYICGDIVSALSLNDQGILAVGSTTRDVALLSNEGSGDCITSFSPAAKFDGETLAKGTGVMQLKWSPCGTYLLVAERQSDCIRVYDMRNTCNEVAVLTGRKAEGTA